MSEEKSSYRQIMKATSLFGGVQVFQIIIQIVRSKFIAILLGPTGMGIAGLLNATIGLIQGLSSFGLGTSAIKNVAEANVAGDDTKISTTVTIVRRLVWITGTLGMLITIVFSRWLSELTFGNKEYTLAFIWISTTLLFKQLTAGHLVVLQGLRKLRHLANANLIGSFLGLITTVPVYYFWGIDGIVPGIIITAAVSLILSWYFSRKTKINNVHVTNKQTIAEGKNMLTMGFMISLSGLITLGASYIVRIFISSKGDVSEVGLYNAGFAIINTYAGLVFTAMGTDYYPRLSEVADNNSLCKQKINQQAEIAILILAPIIVVFLVFIKWIVIILYSNKFVAVDDMIHWAALGMLFKAASWSIAFIFLAKGASRTYFFNELISNSYTLALNLAGYYYWGLTGLGISFMIGYFLYLIQMFFVTKKKYNFNFDLPIKKIFLIQFSLATVCFISVKYLNETPAYLIGGGLILLSCLFSLIELDKRLGLRNILNQLKTKYLNRNQ